MIKNEKNEKNTISFDLFWDAYDKKVDRVRCEKIWNKLSEPDHQIILERVPDYVASTPDKKFRKDPSTYLHNRSWENEVVNNSNQLPKLGW